MAPNYNNSERVISNRFAYWISKPKIGDVILHLRESSYFLKRIIGVPGDKIEIHNRQLTRNGEIVSLNKISNSECSDSSYVHDHDNIECFEEGAGLKYKILWKLPESGVDTLSEMSPVLLGDDQFFVLGDNRSNSNDSRIFGSIELSSIKGRVLFKIPY
jgi:signal peptidase I